MPEPRSEKWGSGCASDFTELWVSNDKTCTGSKANKQTRNKRKKLKWNQKVAAGTAVPSAPGTGQLNHHGTRLRSSAETDLAGCKIKWCAQKPWGFFNKKKHTAEIYLLELQCQRPKFHRFQTFPQAKDTVQRTQQVSLNTKVNVRSTSLHKASTS